MPLRNGHVSSSPTRVPIRPIRNFDTRLYARREFAEETLGLYGGADVDAATVNTSATAMASRLREAVAAASDGAGGAEAGGLLPGFRTELAWEGNYTADGPKVTLFPLPGLPRSVGPFSEAATQFQLSWTRHDGTNSFVERGPNQLCSDNDPIQPGSTRRV